MWGQTGSCDSACEPGCWLEGARWLALAPGSEWTEPTGREVRCGAQNYQLLGALRLHLLPCSLEVFRAPDGSFSPSVAAAGTSAAAAADVIFAAVVVVVVDVAVVVVVVVVVAVVVDVAVVVVVVDVAVVVAAVAGGDGAQGQT